jgi:hypothetical protein
MPNPLFKAFQRTNLSVASPSVASPNVTSPTTIGKILGTKLVLASVKKTLVQAK